MPTHNHKTNEHTGNIKFAFVLNLLFAIAEIIGGVITNSIAIIADAVHDLGDSLSLGAAWFFENYSYKKRDSLYSYGYRRFSLLGAIINAVVLISGTIYVLTEIIARIISPEAVQAGGMIWLAVAGVIVNGLAVFKLRKNTSLNSRMVMLHLLEDVLGWVAVLIAAITIHFTGWHQTDTWLSLAIALWVLYNAVKNLVKVMKVILQASPAGFSYRQTVEELKKLNGVKNIHDLHVWSLDGASHIGSLHVAKSDNADDRSIRNHIRKYFIDHGIQHVTIETENEDEAENCEYQDC